MRIRVGVRHGKEGAWRGAGRAAEPHLQRRGLVERRGSEVKVGVKVEVDLAGGPVEHALPGRDAAGTARPAEQRVARPSMNAEDVTHRCTCPCICPCRQAGLANDDAHVSLPCHAACKQLSSRRAVQLLACLATDRSRE